MNNIAVAKLDILNKNLLSFNNIYKNIKIKDIKRVFTNEIKKTTQITQSFLNENKLKNNETINKYNNFVFKDLKNIFIKENDKFISTLKEQYEKQTKSLKKVINKVATIKNKTNIVSSNFSNNIKYKTMKFSSKALHVAGLLTESPILNIVGEKINEKAEKIKSNENIRKIKKDKNFNNIKYKTMKFSSKALHVAGLLTESPILNIVGEKINEKAEKIKSNENISQSIKHNKNEEFIQNKEDVIRENKIQKNEKAEKIKSNENISQSIKHNKNEEFIQNKEDVIRENKIQKNEKVEKMKLVKNEGVSSNLIKINNSILSYIKQLVKLQEKNTSLSKKEFEYQKAKDENKRLSQRFSSKIKNVKDSFINKKDFIKDKFKNKLESSFLNDLISNYFSYLGIKNIFKKFPKLPIKSIFNSLFIHFGKFFKKFGVGKKIGSRALLGIGEKIGSKGLLGVSSKALLGIGEKIGSKGLLGVSSKALLGIGEKIGSKGLLGVSSKALLGIGEKIGSKGLLGVSSKGLLGVSSKALLGIGEKIGSKALLGIGSKALGFLGGPVGLAISFGLPLLLNKKVFEFFKNIGSSIFNTVKSIFSLKNIKNILTTAFNFSPLGIGMNFISKGIENILKSKFLKNIKNGLSNIWNNIKSALSIKNIGKILTKITLPGILIKKFTETEFYKNFKDKLGNSVNKIKSFLSDFYVNSINTIKNKFNKVLSFFGFNTIKSEKNENLTKAKINLEVPIQNYRNNKVPKIEKQKNKIMVNENENVSKIDKIKNEIQEKYIYSKTIKTIQEKNKLSINKNENKQNINNNDNIKPVITQKNTNDFNSDLPLINISTGDSNSIPALLFKHLFTVGG